MVLVFYKIIDFFFKSQFFFSNRNFSPSNYDELSNFLQKKDKRRVFCQKKDKKNDFCQKEGLRRILGQKKDNPSQRRICGNPVILVLETWNFHQSQTRPREDQNQKILVQLELVHVLYGSTWNLTLTYTFARNLKFSPDPDQTKTRPKPEKKFLVRLELVQVLYG